MRPRDIAIIGGGIHGCSAALQLALRGYRPLVLEKDYVGRHASGVNGGGVRTLGRDFAEVPISLASRELWADIEQLLGDDCGFRKCGQLKIAETPEELEALAARNQALNAMGFSHERLIGADEVRKRVPAIADNCAGGVLVEDDGYAEPLRTTIAFARSAAAHGADILQGVGCGAIERQGPGWRLSLTNGDTIDVGTLVNCAGGWSAQVAQMVGDWIPVEPNGSMQIVTGRLPRFVSPVVSTVGRSLSLKQMENGTVVIGGGRRSPVDLLTGTSTVNARLLAPAVRDAAALFPILRSSSLVRFWSGIEGFTPDRIPVIGTSQRSGVIHACGFSAHGFQLGPIVGRIIADLVTAGRTPHHIAAFAIDRFPRAKASTAA